MANSRGRWGKREGRKEGSNFKFFRGVVGEKVAPPPLLKMIFLLSFRQFSQFMSFSSNFCPLYYLKHWFAP